jgi:SAM-dependent methyltransferase
MNKLGWETPMVKADAEDGLRLNLGCGKHPMEGWVNVDQHLAPGVDLVANLDGPTLTLPHLTERDYFGARSHMRSNSVDEVYGSHVIEHIANVLPLMGELWRVCKPDARATFACPYGSSDDAWENPTHVRPMFVGSWSVFGQPYWWREDYGYRADWVVEEVRLRIKADTWSSALQVATEHDHATLLTLWGMVESERNVVSEMVATLRCNKPARAADRDLQEDKVVVFEVMEPVDAWNNEVREVGRLQMGLPR